MHPLPRRTARTICTLLGACAIATPLAGQRPEAVTTALHDAVAALFAGDTAASGLMVRVSSARHGVVWQSVLDGRGSPNDTAAAIRQPYRIASITKVYTATAIYRLMETGRLSLTDPIGTHLSPRTVAALTGGRYDPSAITIDQVLHHTSGLTDHSVGGEYQRRINADPTHRWTRDEQIALGMTQDGPLNAPGAAWHYSDTGYLLLGEIVERLTGQPLPAAIRTLAGFHRLGITESWFETLEPAPVGAGRMAPQYLRGQLATGIDASIDLYGGGGLLATMEDQDRYLRALVDGRVFQQATTLPAIMAAAPAATPRTGLLHRGLFFSETQHGHACMSHTGFWGSVALYCPDAGIAVVATTNKASTQRLQKLIARVIPLLDSIPVPPAASTLARCSDARHLENLHAPLTAASDDWYDVRNVEPGVFAFVESRQQQEIISWLIVGERRALLFDTGMGMRPLRPVVERITSLPVTVLNSHTHPDHIGRNAEFSDVRAMRTAFTRNSMRGKTHAQMAEEVSSAALCGNARVGFDTATYAVRPWVSAGANRNEARFDLGGRVIEVLAVPGHTPDAIALRDRAAGLLWTGDTFYAGPIWLFMPETDLDAYAASIARLVALTPSVRRLLPAHNTVVASPALLPVLQDAIAAMRAGRATGTTPGPGQRQFFFDGFSVLVNDQTLAAWQRAAGGRTGTGQRP